jgi:cytochrome c-type biogenesis protein CcmH
MRSKKIIILLLLSFLLSGLVLVAPALALSVNDIARDLICTCGCGKVLDVCEMESARQMRALIKEMIDQGQDRDQIVTYFVDQYGEKVLATPPKKGFNLTAWIIPFVVIAIGAGIIYLVITKWVLRGKIRPKYMRKTDLPEIEDKYSEKLKKELEEFEF